MARPRVRLATSSSSLLAAYLPGIIAVALQARALDNLGSCSAIGWSSFDIGCFALTRVLIPEPYFLEFHIYFLFPAPLHSFLSLAARAPTHPTFPEDDRGTQMPSGSLSGPNLDPCRQPRAALAVGPGGGWIRPLLPNVTREYERLAYRNYRPCKYNLAPCDAAVRRVSSLGSSFMVL